MKSFKTYCENTQHQYKFGTIPIPTVRLEIKSQPIYQIYLDLADSYKDMYLKYEIFWRTMNAEKIQLTPITPEVKNRIYVSASSIVSINISNFEIIKPYIAISEFSSRYEIIVREDAPYFNLITDELLFNKSFVENCWRKESNIDSILMQEKLKIDLSQKENSIFTKDFLDEF